MWASQLAFEGKGGLAAQRVTQEQLAARLQSQGIAIDRSAISKIEAGKRPVTDLEIIAICNVLGIKVATLFGEE